MTEINITSAVIEQFVKHVNADTAYTISDLKKILTQVYKDNQAAANDKKKAEKAENGEKPKKPRTKRERDENGEIIKKREPSAYNLFIKDQTAKIRAANPVLDSKTIFKMAIDEWKKQKNCDQAPEIVEVIDEVKDTEPQAPHTSPVDDQVIDATTTVKPKKARKAKTASQSEDDV